MNVWLMWIMIIQWHLLGHYWHYWHRLKKRRFYDICQKKRPWTRKLCKLCTTGNSFSPPFRQIILQPSQKTEFIWNLTAKSKMATKNRYDALMPVWNRQQLRRSLATRDLHHPRSTTHTGFRLHLIYNSHIYSIGTTMSTKTFWNLEAETSQVWKKAM